MRQAGGPTFDPEKFQLNIARLDAGGETFEVVVDPDAAIAYRDGSLTDFSNVLKAKHIYAHAQKGMLALSQKFKPVFNTEDEVVISKQIVTKGELHLTREYKNALRETKLKQIIQIIHVNGVDPRTDAPHPLNRIERAVAQAKVKVDEFRSADDQVPLVLKKLQPILPIRFEKKEIRMQIRHEYASKVKAALGQFGELTGVVWNSDGSFSGSLIIPGGIEEECVSKINALTHGSAHVEIVRIK